MMLSRVADHQYWMARQMERAENLARQGTLYHSNLTDGIKVRWCSLGENVGMGPSVDAVEKAFWQRGSAANQGRRTSNRHLAPSAGEVSCRVRLWEVSRPVSWLYP